MVCKTIYTGSNPVLASMIENSLIIALIILFLHATTWDGHIFQKVRKWISEDFNISKPIYNCPICMTPWWGTLIYLIFIHYSFSDYILTIGAASGLSVISVVLIAAKDYFTKDK
jgi:hypothetical protein